MARQPDNILLTFENVESLSGNNTLNYYYREGVIYMDGGENLPEFKRLALTNEQLSRTTRLIKREDNTGGQVYTTVEGQTINLQQNDELYVSHNYTGNNSLDKTFNTNSWWYDINFHKSYRTYLVVRYSSTITIGGEIVYNLRIADAVTVYKSDAEDDKSGVYTFTSTPPGNIGITSSIMVDQKFNGNTWETVNLNLYYNDALIAQETLDITSTTLPEKINLLLDYPNDAISINDTLKMSVEVNGAPAIHDDSLLITEYTMSVSSETEVDVPETILGFNENLGLDRDFDCQPTLNNVTVLRQSEFVQDVDYSISVIPPVESSFIRTDNVSITHNFNTEDVTISVLDQGGNIIARNEYNTTLLLNSIIINFVDPTNQRPVLKSGTIVVTKNGGGISSPQNLSLILSNKALKASTPDSNYSQYSSIIPKYYGTKTNRTGVNLTDATSYNFQQVNPSNNNDLPLSPFYFTTDNLGSFANVESRNSYIGYFEKILDPYPVLNGKTAYFVKYLIDENTDVLDPSLTVQGLNNIKNTFKTNDINNLPTSVKASVQNIDEARELKDLENFATVYKVAEYPSPILFSQTASNGYANQIQMTGSGDLYINNVDLDPATYKNIAFTATDTVAGELSTQPINFNFSTDNPITSLGGGLGGDGEFFKPEDREYIGEPNEEIYSNVEGIIKVTKDETIGTATGQFNSTVYTLTDDYKLSVEYSFYTSHLPPVVGENGPSLDTFGGMEFQAEIKAINEYILGFTLYSPDLTVEKVELTAWKPESPWGIQDAGATYEKGVGQSVTVDLTPGTVYVPSGISSNRAPIVQTLQSTSLLNSSRYTKINFDSTQIYTALRRADPEGFPVWLQSGKINDYNDSKPNYASDLQGYASDPNLNNYLDYFKGAYLQWKVKLVQTLPDVKDSGGTTNDGYELRVKRKGSITSTYDSNVFAIKRQQQFLNTFTNLLSYDQYNAYRCFNPPGIENVNRHYLRYDLKGLKTPSAENLGIANAPYWDFVNGNRSRIYLVPPLLNNNYGSGYYQSPSPYTPSINTAFPFSKEPPYTLIPTPSDPLEFFPGDQIRFVNLESQVYTITNVSEGEIDGNQRIILNLDKSVTAGINLDFFLVRRFKPANNFVILNQQKPYGVPPSESSAPGILQTEYQNIELETNPDKVITNLIERNLI